MYIYLSESQTLLLSNLYRFRPMVTLSNRRGAERHAIAVVGVVTVAVTVVVDITKVRG